MHYYHRLTNVLLAITTIAFCVVAYQAMSLDAKSPFMVVVGIETLFKSYEKTQVLTMCIVYAFFACHSLHGFIRKRTFCEPASLMDTAYDYLWLLLSVLAIATTILQARAIRNDSWGIIIGVHGIVSLPRYVLWGTLISTGILIMDYWWYKCCRLLIHTEDWQQWHARLVPHGMTVISIGAWWFCTHTRFHYQDNRLIGAQLLGGAELLGILILAMAVIATVVLFGLQLSSYSSSDSYSPPTDYQPSTRAAATDANDYESTGDLVTRAATVERGDGGNTFRDNWGDVVATTRDEAPWSFSGDRVYDAEGNFRGHYQQPDSRGILHDPLGIVTTNEPRFTDEKTGRTMTVERNLWTGVDELKDAKTGEVIGEMPKKR